MQADTTAGWPAGPSARPRSPPGGAFIRTVVNITLIMAMLASLILFLHFWKWIILAALLVMGISLVVKRLRELTGRAAGWVCYSIDKVLGSYKSNGITNTR